MTNKRLHDWIGLSGVGAHENPRAKMWAKRLDLPLLLLALWIVISWYWETTTQATLHNNYIDWGVWLFFVIETCVLSLLVDNTKSYLTHNWLNLVIIISGFPMLWLDSPTVGGLRVLRILIFVSLMLQLSGSIQRVLARNHLGATLAVSAIFIIFAGYLIAAIDPAINTPADGIWWAWITATTVGYGDIVPVSQQGRIIAGILILLGIVLLSLITANTSAYFIASQRDQNENKRLKKIEKQLNRIEQQLESLSQKNEPPDL
ncbi:potassium channel family protein [Oceanicoccus sp. KOV_DT_Chl]|uniref:potassium channel family protein n=1 Tax=Oceanicoccus sp. KOV_DT_Chl TaxID=1904639 RepID=UPI000C7C4E0E|nr:potassium channel family protein [Oceanicoccus sp. KOV_DT_Chl]